MNDLEILESQIRRQIEGRIDIKVYFPDCKPDFISLYDQNHGYFIEPAAKPAKKITEIQYDELMSQVKNGEIKTNLQYDWFFNRYYNTPPAIKGDRYVVVRDAGEGEDNYHDITCYDVIDTAKGEVKKSFIRKAMAEELAHSLNSK